MAWGMFSLETMLRRIFRYIIRRYFGQYLEEFSQKELTYGLGRGKGSVENVRLNVDALNELGQEYNLPVEFLHGSIDLVSIMVPWSALLSENTVVELKGLNLLVQPRERPEDASMFDSMWGSMTSSLQLAEECLKCQDDTEEEIDVSNVSDGLEKIAKTIDAVLSNLKVRFFDTVIRIQHFSNSSSSGVALEIRIANGEYFDEAGVNVPTNSNVNYPAESYAAETQAQTYATKKVLFEGIGLYTAEISLESQLFSNSEELSFTKLDSAEFVPGSPEMPPTHSTLPVKSHADHLRHPEPILISKLNGQHELRLKLKQDEAVSGPKVDVEFNFGAVNLFLSPLQVHMMLQLVQGLLKPGPENHNSKKMYSITNKPMRAADYALVEQELQRQQEKPTLPSKSLKNHHGWSSHSFDESDADFELMVMENRPLSELQPPILHDLDSSFSSNNSDTRSDFSNMNPGFNRRTSKSKGTNIEAMLNDPLTELTQFRGCCSSLCIIVLHDDSVHESANESNSNFRASEENSQSLKERAEKYFDDLLALQMTGFDFKNFSTARNPISQLCQSNHLRLMATSLSIDGNEKSSSSQCILNFSLSLYSLEILECLFNSTNVLNPSQMPTYMEIVSFRNSEVPDKVVPDLKKPCFKMKYQKIECISEHRIFKPPTNKLDLYFEPVVFEVDISLTDRIRTLLNPKTFFSEKSTKSCDTEGRDESVTMNKMSQKTEVNFSSPFVVIKLRFPIPDLRSVHDRERMPWWQQNLRDEILIFELSDLTLATTIDSEQSESKYEIQCRDLHGLLQICTTESPVSFLRVAVDPDADKTSQDKGFDWPRLVIRKKLNLSSIDYEAESSESEEFCYSLSEALISNLETEPSPFCSSSVAYGSKLKNNANDVKSDEAKSSHHSDHDEMIKPADKKQVLNFIEQISTHCEYSFEFSLRTLNLVLPDRNFYELLFNRLGMDLALWENTSLVQTTTYDANRFKVHAPGFTFSEQNLKDEVFQSFNSFKSFANDTDSDNDEPGYSSIHEYWQRSKKKQKKRTNNINFTKIAVSIGISKASVAIHTPVLDYSDNIVPGKCGKLQLLVEDGTLFIANSYKGDPNEAYVCLLSEKSSLHHEGLAVQPTERTTVLPYSSSLSSRLPSIIHQSEKGVSFSSTEMCDNNGNNQDMLTIAVHILRNPKQQMKTFKVGVGIYGATLRHYMCPLPEMWINEFMGFLRIIDYPINGYTPSACVTELHINLRNCAIDYRPLNLPLRSVLTVDNFNLSCNVSANTPSFLFRIISEEMRLFISNNTTARKIELRKNYICVIDTGLINVSFRTNANDKDGPQFELCATNNIIHIRTCADSFRALCDILIYVNMCGDLVSQSPSENKDSKGSDQSGTGKKSEVDSDNVHHLMAEAMKDSRPNQMTESSVFDSEMQKQQVDSDQYSTDEEFCIIEDDPGIGLIPKNGEPQIRMLTNEPIIIVENHFTVPPGKSDDLKAPKHFPNPTLRIALREMTLVWHLFGGSDFSSAKRKEKKTVRINTTEGSDKLSAEDNDTDAKSIDIDAHNGVISFCKVTPLTRQFDINAVHYSMEHISIDQSRVNSPPVSWVCIGGADRNHDVLMELHMSKVRFQREVYAEDSEYASRYILLIHDIEVRDRLASSQINKFLYQYSSASMPRQSHANMVEVKGVYTRPDMKLTCQECSLKVSCKPLRLNVDQDALMFLIDFFQDVMGTAPIEDLQAENLNSKQFPSSSNKADPVVQVKIKLEECLENEQETFYRYFSFSPDVFIRLDYQGKRVVMEQGAIQGLLMGLGQLNCSEIKLKRLCYRHGLLGHQKVFNYAVSEWQQDIMKNQLPSLLGGVGPMYSFVQLFQGIRDLFYLPVEQYRKDGQIVRGIQRGAYSFSTSTAMAILDLTSRLVSAIQSAAEVTYDMVSPGPSVTRNFQRAIDSHRRSNQPADIREGVATAYNVVMEGLEDTARAIYRVASEEHEHKGVPGAVGGVLRQIPPAVVKPIIVGSEATHIMLGGVRHQLMPDAHHEDIKKWRTKK